MTPPIDTFRSWIARAEPALLILLLPLALLLPGCDPAEPPLRVGSVSYDESRLLGLSEDRLDELVLISVIAEARVRGDEERIGAPVMERVVRSARVRTLREEIGLEAAGVSEADLQERYRVDPDEELEVRHLVILSERWRPDSHRNEARSRAAAARERVLGGEDFAEVAGEVSEEPGARRRGGLLDPGREGTWVSEFWNAASALDEGEVSPVVESEFGFHVLKLEARNQLPFDEGRARIVREVAAELGGITAWDEWRQEHVEAISLRHSAIADLQLDDPHRHALGNPGAGSGTDARAPHPDHEVVLADWPGGGFTVGELVRDLQGSRSALWREVRQGTADERAARVRELAIERRLAEFAHDRGIEATEAEVAPARREWDRRILTWTAFLDLPEGMSPDEAAERSLAALRTNEQNARVARSELAEWAPALLAAYPVHRQGGDSP